MNRMWRDIRMRVAHGGCMVGGAVACLPLDFEARVAIAQVTNEVAPLRFRVAHEAKATCAHQRLHCVGRARLWAGMS
jgi:hypothetical protein